MSVRPQKILALQFKYFGDAVLMTPALRALREHFPQAELHLLVPAEIAPLFQSVPWLDRVWAMPRKRGRASLRQTWPLIRALRRENFDRSIDFAGNDRGALVSFLVGAKRRLGWAESGGFWGRKFSYHDRVAPGKIPTHESVRLAQLLVGWNIPSPASFTSELRADPALAEAAKKILPDNHAVICHIASSQPKKEWPAAHWAELYQLAQNEKWPLVFTTARGEREAALMTELKTLIPDALILPLITDLPLFLAVLRRANVFISGDTGPLHFAAGLGVPTISLFGPTTSARWAPIGSQHRVLTGSDCHCDGNSPVCLAAVHCLSQVSPRQVFAALQQQFSTAK